MEKADSCCPDFIFMDIGLPDESGLELTKKIKSKYPNVCVAMLTSHDGLEYREAAIRNGASHYLTKGNVSREEIQNLVKSSLSEKK
jgi:two-component system response regulator YesN